MRRAEADLSYVAKGRGVEEELPWDSATDEDLKEELIEEYERYLTFMNIVMT